MEKRVQLEKRGRSSDQIKELNLDNCRSSNIEGLDESFVNLEKLSIINTGLSSLKGFPKLPALRALELSDNRIVDGLDYLSGCPMLENLNLSGNKIKDFDVLGPLKELHNLVVLDLFNCEVTEVPDYRQKVFELIPSLKFLDGYDFNNKEMIEDEDLEDFDEDDEEEDAPAGEDDEEESDEEEDEESDEETVSLSYLTQDKIDEEDEKDDFVPGEDEDDDEDDDLLDEEEDGPEPPKGVKRPAEDSEDSPTKK